MEEWRDVEGYEGIYKISNFANLKSLDRKVKINGKNQFTTFGSYKNVKGKDTAKVVNQHGYYQVVLYKNGKKKKYRWVFLGICIRK